MDKVRNQLNLELLQRKFSKTKDSSQQEQTEIPPNKMLVLMHKKIRQVLNLKVLMQLLQQLDR